MIPRNSETLTSINTFGQQFGVGLLQPFYVIFNNTAANTTDALLTNTNFGLMNQMVQSFINISQERFTGNLSYLQLNTSQILAPFYYGQPLSPAVLMYLRAVQPSIMLLLA